MSKLVYLDSSDFSTLSAPEVELSEENRAVLSVLRQNKSAGTAKFFMSAVHFSEAVHAAGEHKLAAIRRAQLMAELCEKNLLRFPTEIAKRELRIALQSDKSPRLSNEEIISKNGEWFGFESSLNSLFDARRDLNQQIEGMLAKLPRRERRKLQSELNLEKRSSHQKWRQIIRNGTSPAVVQFPLSLLNQETAVSWFLGEIPDADFREIILAVMNDPHTMFKYFLDETGHREALYDVVRKQGRDLASSLYKSAEALMPMLNLVVNSEVEIDLTALINESCSRPDFLRRYVVAYADVSADHISDTQIKTIVESCPSLFAFIETSKAYLVSSAAAHIMRIRAGNAAVKKFDSSDFGDMMHSFYAPYFDVFRCDVRFGAHLKKHKPVRAQIADRIGDLLRMLPPSEIDCRRA